MANTKIKKKSKRGSKIPKFTMVLTSTPITVKKKRLKDKWTCEIDQKMVHYYVDKNGVMRRIIL